MLEFGDREDKIGLCESYCLLSPDSVLKEVYWLEREPADKSRTKAVGMRNQSSARLAING